MLHNTLASLLLFGLYSNILVLLVNRVNILIPIAYFKDQHKFHLYTLKEASALVFCKS